MAGNDRPRAARPASAPPPARTAEPLAGIGRVLVLADGEKTEVRGLLARLEPWLRARVRSVAVEPDARAFYRLRQEASAQQRGLESPGLESKVEPPDLPDLSGLPDLIVVLGGDGAILGAVRAFAEVPVPTIGINFGRVGFLAAAEAGSWEQALTEILDGAALVEPRMRLEAELHAAGAAPVRAVALNDVVLSRGAYQGLLEIALKIGEEWVTNYRADGLIVATASGSTAYSLASGGPILAPTMQDLVVTPICPQSLSHRTIVLPTASELWLSITQSSGITTLVVDGQGFYPMKQGDRVRLRRHPQAYPLLARPGEDFFKRLRERLGWRGSFEPDVFPPREGGDPRGPEADSGGSL